MTKKLQHENLYAITIGCPILFFSFVVYLYNHLHLMIHLSTLQVLGAFWYLFSIERETTCWQSACGNRTDCIHASLYCLDDHLRFKQFLNDSCPIQTPDTTRFDFGIFLNALQSGIVESMDFPRKFFYCFWWGLQNLRYCHCSFYFST